MPLAVDFPQVPLCSQLSFLAHDTSKVTLNLVQVHIPRIFKRGYIIIITLWLAMLTINWEHSTCPIGESGNMPPPLPPSPPPMIFFATYLRSGKN